MFLGQYQHSLDDKGRLTIPSAFRETLGDGAYISQGLDRNLMVMGSDYFLRIYERINSLSITDPESRLFKRLILSSAYKVDLDKAGRILVPTNLRQFLSLTEATLVGQGDYFEVWTTSDWDLQIKNLFDTDANSKRFAMLDLSMRK